MSLKIWNYRLEKEHMSLIKLMELKAKNMWEWVVSLSQWIPWYDMPEELKKSLCDYTSNTKAKDYTLSQWILELREKMVRLYNLKYNSNFTSEEVLITSGAIEAISSLLLTLITKNTDEVIMFEPTYASYDNIINITWAKHISCPLNKKFGINFNKLKQSINENTRAIVLVNPNNPTGTFIDLKDVEKVLKLIKWKNIYLITDEVYNYYIFDKNKWEDFSHLKLFDKYKKQLVIINSWSKSFWITGWRIGYMISNKYLVKQVLKIHDSLVTCAPSHSQYAVMQNLDILFKYWKKINKQLEKRRDFVVKRLEKMSDFIDFEIPNWSYYIFPKFKYTKNYYIECMRILNEVKLSLVPGWIFWSWGKGHFRICYGRDMDFLVEWLDRLEKYFKNKD